MAKVRPSATLLSAIIRRRALESIDGGEAPLRNRSAGEPIRLSDSTNLALINRQWLITCPEDEVRPSAWTRSSWLRFAVRPLWAAFSALVARAIMKTLTPYLLHEREFFVHLVRFANESSEAVDQRQLALLDLADALEARGAAQRRDLVRLRDQIQSELDRLNDRIDAFEQHRARNSG